MGSIINVQILEANYTSSSVHENLKLQGETGMGDNSIYLGAYKTDKEKTMFESFLGTQLGSPVEVTVFKQDLLDYLENAKPEFEDPQQTYREDISLYYEKLKSYVQSINKDSIVIKFKTSIRKKKDSAQIWIFKNPNDPNFDYLYSICLPRLSQLRFYKDLSSNQLYLKPLFDDKLKIKEKPIAYFPLVKNSEHYPLQQIFYGAPGTGKSFKTNEVAQKYSTIRTTFHPDSDYSTFVGAYKPTTFKQDRYGLYGSDTVVLKYPDGINKDHPISESKIEYRFVKQAFLKAYIKAWKLFVLSQHGAAVQSSPVNLSVGNDKWVVSSMDDEIAYYTKKSTISISDYEKWVKKCWEDIRNSENPDEYEVGTTERYQATVCFWYKENNSIERTSEECWNSVKEELEKGNSIVFSPGTRQHYTVTIEDGSIVVTSVSRAKKETVKGYFDPIIENNSKSVQNIIAKKLKELSSDFNEAWDKLKATLSLNQASSFTSVINIDPLFLVIEEINRGNCAQIFGDLFQLLDRKNGFSEYPIDADEDIRKCLLSEDTDEDPSFGISGLKFTEDQKAIINNVYNSGDGTPFRDVANDIACGKLLVLPSNLYIWATMNTSDQSLFPIDSAFKRRWEWKYIKIKEGKDKNGNKLDWKVDIKMDEAGNLLSWWSFIQKINEIIASMTSSADKQLGYFFCQANDEKKITTETFVSKVIFYLWNDVFKDYGFEDASLFRYITKDNEGKETEMDLTFPDFYDEDGEKVNSERLTDFVKKVMNWKKTSEENS